MSLKETAKKFEAKLKKIKVIAFDVDGILTDGHLWYAGEEVGWNRNFFIYDGYGIKLMMKAGLKVGFITGGNSISLKKRAELLKVDFCHYGSEDKREAFLSLMKDYNVSADEILYMGDEEFDIPLLKKAGFSATVPNATEIVQGAADYVTIKESGKGCAREVIELVRYAQGIVSLVEDF